jgi:hypothetical protein
MVPKFVGLKEKVQSKQSVAALKTVGFSRPNLPQIPEHYFDCAVSATSLESEALGPSCLGFEKETNEVPTSISSHGCKGKNDLQPEDQKGRCTKQPNYSCPDDYTVRFGV